VLGLAGQEKARIAGEIHVALVVVMIDPGGQPASQAVDERDGDARERRAPSLGREANVQHHHPPASVSAGGSFRGVRNAKRTPLPASTLVALMGWG
jgi:hypothetical protein